jgi:hypothetical protein
MRQPSRARVPNSPCTCSRLHRGSPRLSKVIVRSQSFLIVPPLSNIFLHLSKLNLYEYFFAHQRNSTMASPRSNSTARHELEQRQPPHLPMGTTCVAGPRIPPTRNPRRSHGPPPSAIPTYIPNPFEEYVPVRSTAELGPDLILNRQPTSRMNLPEPGSRTGFYMDPTDTFTLVSPVQSNENTATDSARVTPPAPWLRQGDRIRLLERIAPPGHTHTPPNAMVYQGTRVRDQQVAVGTNNITALSRRGQTASARGANLFGQRGPILTQPNAENVDPRSNPNPGEQEVVYLSSSDAPFGEPFDRAFDVFQQPFFQNYGDVTTVAPQ